MKKLKQRHRQPPGIDSGQFEKMRAAFYTYGSIARAATAAGVEVKTAKKYVDEPHPAFGNVSIREIVRRQKENEARELMSVVSVARHSSLQEHTRRMMETLKASQRVKLAPRGKQQPDGSLAVTSSEYNRIMAVVESELRVIDKLSDRVFPEQAPKEGGVSIALQFQGQRDMGHVVDIPAEPATLFESQLQIQHQHDDVFNALTSDSGDSVVASIRRAVKKRLQES